MAERPALPTDTLHDRLVYAFVHFFEGDILKAKNQLGASNRLIRKALVQRKPVTEAELRQLYRGFAKHASIDSHWLETGEGNWRRKAGNTLLMGTTPPDPRLPEPDSDAKNPLLQSRQDSAPLSVYVSRRRESQGALPEEAVAAGVELTGAPEHEELSLEEIERLTRPRTCTGCGRTVATGIEVCPDCGCGTTDMALASDAGETNASATPPPVVRESPAPAAPTPAILPSPLPTPDWEQVFLRVAEGIQAAREAQRLGQEIAQRDEDSQRLAQEVRAAHERVCGAESQVAAALTQASKAVGALSDLQDNWKGLEDRWTERLALVVAQVNREVQAALELAQQAVQEVTQPLVTRLAEMDEYLRELSSQVDGLRRDVVTGGRLREVIRQVVRSEIPHTPAPAVAAFDPALLERIVLLETKLEEESNGRAAVVTALEELEQKVAAGQVAPRRHYREEADIAPEVCMPIAKWERIKGPHQRYLQRNQDRQEMGKSLCAAYRLYKIMGDVDEGRLDINNGFYPVADMRHYIKWLSMAGLEPRREDWLEYFHEHALGEWSTRTGLNVPVKPEK